MIRIVAVAVLTLCSTAAFANRLGGIGATMYRVGNDYLVVARDGKILSYVPNATAGQGVAATYMQLGGK